MLEFLSQPWPWYVAGPLVSLTMFSMLYFGRSFGLSTTFSTVCTIGGAGKINNFFNNNWKSQIWNLVFVAGMVIGGFIAATWLQQPEPINLSPDTIAKLQELGIKDPGESYLPREIFSWQGLFTLPGFILLVGGGFLGGFGARYAGGCTSGHVISGLSNLQLPSFIAVTGFFIGGLLATYIVLPLILQLK
ncbi:MAG: YeeE/YedE family protein [Candidatus Cyclobacteriaceae bacterium M3_2C_046]